MSRFLFVFLVFFGLFDPFGSSFAGTRNSCEAKQSPSIISNGLRNLGNTCYMNAQLQCAFHIPVFRKIATASISSTDILPTAEDDESSDSSKPKATEASLALKELIENMIKSSNERSLPYMPGSFCTRLGIPPRVQQDSQEFWKLLLPAVGIERLSDLYKGVYEDYITAIDGSGREKRRDEVFLDLSLDVSTSVSLMESLKDSFGDPELLSVSEGNGWRPEKGAEKVDAHKGSSLVAKGLPSILQFHLKRFDYDWQTDTTTKLNNRFTFPKSLDLASICVDVDGPDSRSEYELQAVVVHVGEYGVGHYYAYVRPDIECDEWYRFNDDQVEKVTFGDVVEDSFGGQQTDDAESNRRGLHRRVARLFRGRRKKTFGWGGRTSNAYVIQYVKKSDIESLYSRS